MTAPRCYLAGPGVFRPDHQAFAISLKQACARAGLEGVFPLDAEIPPQASPEATAAAIRDANLALIKGCSAVIAEMTPFRGPGMDGGTAYEMGFAAALGLPCYGWSADGRIYRIRVESLDAGDGMSIEDFGLAENLMMGSGLADGTVHPDMDACCRAAALGLGAVPA